MPNWCDNRITIMTDTPEEMLTIREFLKEDDNVFSLNAIVPRPEILNRVMAPLRRDEDGRILLDQGVPATDEETTEIEAAGGTDWYTWSVTNWGTKWDTAAQDIDLDEIDENQVVYRFATAWSPPQTAIFALRDHFPDAHIEAFFDEPGVQSAGYY